MPFTLTMPKLSPTMEEGAIAKWHKKEGEYVESGELLLEVATDKATVEHNAIDSGWVRKILIPEGKAAIVNQAIAVLTEEKSESIEGYQPQGAEPAKRAAQEAPTEDGEVEEKREVPSKPRVEMRQAAFVPEPPITKFERPQQIGVPNKQIKASPLARKLAKEKGLDLSTVSGTGPGQRIISRDLEKAQPAGEMMFGRRETPQLPPGSYEEEPLSQMRKVIAQRLQDSKSFVPHFYVQVTVDAQPIVNLREQLVQFELKPSFNDLVVRACALALRKHPEVNSGFNSVNQTIIRFKTIDISVAVNLPEGLITPIVRHADFKNVGELSAEIRQLAKRAKEGKLDPQEYKGGSFTVSNMGMYGVTDFQAIINPPQAAILAIGGILDTPVVRDGSIVPGKILNLTLSVDHRVIDGVKAAEYLKTLKKYLENPAALLL